jgi:hypothetical protein
MIRKLALLSGGMAAAALLVAATTLARGHASAGIPDGSFVMASDGSLWAVANGSRFSVVIGTDADDQLFGLPEGQQVATIGALNAAIAAMAPQPPAGQPYLDYTFTGRDQSPTFFAEGRVEVCWDLNPAAMTASMTLNPEGSSFWVSDGFFNGISRSGCRTTTIVAGQYYINVSIPQSARGQTTNLRVVVRPAP